MAGLIAGLVLLAAAAAGLGGLAWDRHRRLGAVEREAARQGERLAWAEALLAQSPAAAVVWG
jgi:hypothetical protein